MLPEHRLYLLTLICFYIKSEEKEDFSDLELEFLMRGSKYNTNINIQLSDFGVPKNVKPPSWIPADNWNDLLALSLLQGDLDHFVVGLISAEAEWKNGTKIHFESKCPRSKWKSTRVQVNKILKIIIEKF